MSQRRTEAFLLRLVFQDDQTDPEMWHGRVQHIGSGDERMFRTLQEALTFIRYRCERLQERNASPDDLPPQK